MLIVCPSCASEYSIDPDLVGAGGRRMRCAACRTTWRVDAPGGAAEPTAVAEAPAEAPAFAEPVAAGAPSTRAARARRRVPQAPALAAIFRRAAVAAGRIGPALALACLVAAAGWAVTARHRVVRTVPGTAALFAAIGLPANGRGLEFRGVSSRIGTEEGAPVLTVDGEVVGVAAERTPVPPIALAVRGDGPQALYTWTIEPPRAMVNRGETARFRARLASPPPEGREVLVRFADGPAAAALALRAPSDGDQASR